jgi:hypothetical protein
MGPEFRLFLYATERTDSRGCTVLAYRLKRCPNGIMSTKSQTTLFEGEDFRGSPLHADDSDATVKALLSFLTLRPGDTDAEYFDSYTDAQQEWLESHEPEALACEVERRFGEDD